MTEKVTPRFEEINRLLIELASGNYDVFGDISESHDEWDAIITGINMLGEELKHTTISRDYLDSIYRGVVDMLVIFSPDRTILTVNEFLKNTLGYTDEEVVGQSIDNFIQEIEIGVLDQLIRDLNEKGYSYNTELQFKASSGKLIPASCSTSMIIDNQGTITGILMIAKDITQIKKTEKELLIKNRELDTLFYKTSHDLKSPITTILGISNLAEMETQDQNILRYLDMIKKCANNLEEILEKIRQIREVNHLEDPLYESIEPIMFNDFIKPLVDLLTTKNNLQEKDILLKMECNQKTPYLGSKKLINTVLVNVLDTAIRSRKNEGICLIACQIKETLDGLMISIRDNGVGMIKSLQGKAFDMFTKTNSKPGGTGLEYYTVKNIITKLEGDVKLISEEGIGTEIQIFLPFQKLSATHTA